MINYREIRIGSIVFANGKERVVSSIIGPGNDAFFDKNDFQVCLNYEVGIGVVSCGISDIMPIEISGELLLRMGFSEQRKGYFVLIIKRHDLASEWNCWRYAIQMKGKRFSFQGTCVEYNHDLVAHNLQNYIFETSGHFVGVKNKSDE